MVSALVVLAASSGLCAIALAVIAGVMFARGR